MAISLAEVSKRSVHREWPIPERKTRRSPPPGPERALLVTQKRVQPESNRRPQDLQSHALPLSYAPGEGAILAPGDSTQVPVCSDCGGSVCVCVCVLRALARSLCATTSDKASVTVCGCRVSGFCFVFSLAAAAGCSCGTERTAATK